ncbi:MAG: hypothetical protein EXS10_03315 [Phycisphaerales bacterium]|nr:hypothetical protein [Phycisphaerales bacterium]
MQYIAVLPLLSLFSMFVYTPAPPLASAPQATDERLEHALALLARLDEKIVLNDQEILTVGSLPVWLRLKGFPLQVDTARLMPRADTTAFEQRVAAGETTYGALLSDFARAAGSEFDPWSIDSDGFTLLLLPDSTRDRLALTAIYDVSALAQQRASREVPQGDTTVAVQKQVTTISDLLHEHIAPDGWTDMGGKLVSLRADGDDLIITSAPAVHRSIRELFRQLEIAAGLEQVLVAAEMFEFAATALGDAPFSSAQLDALVQAEKIRVITAPRLLCLPIGDAKIEVTSERSSLILVFHAERTTKDASWICEASIDQPNFKGSFRVPLQVGGPPTCAMMRSATGEHCIALRVRASAKAADPVVDAAK